MTERHDTLKQLHSSACGAPDFKRSPYLQSFDGRYDVVCMNCGSLVLRAVTEDDDVPVYDAEVDYDVLLANMEKRKR